MKRYSDYGIDAPDTGSGEHYTLCPKCSRDRKKQGVKSLSVNLDKHVWHCHHCGWTGHLEYTDNEKRDYAMLLDTPKPSLKQASIEKINAISTRLLDLSKEALKWLLDERGILEDTAKLAGLKSSFQYMPQVGKEIEVIAFPFYRNGELVNVKYRSFEKHFSQEKGGLQCFYQFEALKDTDQIIITEGELDTLALMEAGFNNVVSCPSGAPPLNAVNIEGKLSFLADAAELLGGIERVILAMDKDQPGVRWESEIAKKIGLEKCFTVRYPEDCKDANDVLKKQGREKLIACINAAKPFPVAGIAEFRDFEKQILDYREHGANSGLKTGWNSLDEFYRLKPGTLNIITGIPGSGKSEFLDQLMVNTIDLHKWKWALFSPENYPPEFHFQKLAEKLSRKPMFKGWSKDPMTPEEIQKAILCLSEYIKILTIDEEGLTIDNILERVKVCAMRYGIKGFILDPYNEVEHARPAGLSETEYISSFLSKVRNFGRIHNIAMFIVAHPVKLNKCDRTGEYPIPSPYDISGSAHWRNKADNCLSVWRSYTNDENKVQVHIQKIRDKNLGKVGMVEFDWIRATGTFLEPKRFQKIE